MRYYDLEAIILKREAWRENDVVVTVYSREKGKLRLLLKGAKHITSKMAGHVEPVSLVSLNVVTRKGDMDQVIGAQMRKSFAGVKRDIKKLGYATYFLEVVDGLIKGAHEDARLFGLIVGALDKLEHIQHVENLPLMRLVFVFKLLYILGLRPRVEDGELDRVVEVLVREGVDDVLENKLVWSSQRRLFEISESSLKQHLDGPLGSEDFLKNSL